MFKSNTLGQNILFMLYEAETSSYFRYEVLDVQNPAATTTIVLAVQAPKLLGDILQPALMINHHQ